MEILLNERKHDEIEMHELLDDHLPCQRDRGLPTG
jgi:hypothetical protein